MIHVCKKPGLLRRILRGIHVNAPVLSYWRCQCGQTWQWRTHGFYDDRVWVRVPEARRVARIVPAHSLPPAS